MKSLSCFVFLLTAGMVYGQTCEVKGRVFSAGSPLEYANVIIKGTATGTTTDAKGEFLLPGLSPGKKIIQVSVLGYETVVKEVNVKPENTTELQIEMKELGLGLDEVVITGTMKEVSKSESPVPVEIYSPKFFRKNPTPALFESLQNVNGVRPQINCSVCNTGDIHINGMEGPYTLVMIDGMPIVSGLATVYGLNGIPNSLVERIEIVKGPASALYGSEAVGGIVNVITKSPLNAPVVSVDVFGTDWGEVNTDIGFRKNLKRSTTLLGINYFNYTNPIDRNGDGFTDVTLQNRISVFNKWDFKRKDSKTAGFAVRYVYEDRWGGEMNWTPAFRGTDSIYGESIYTSRAEIIGNYELPVKEKIIFNYSLSAHKQDSYYGTTSFDAEQHIGFAQLYWNKRKGLNEILAGTTLRAVYYDDNTPATQQGDSLIINRADKILMPGLFIQDELALNENNLFLLGTRYDHHPRHGHILSPRLNYKWTPNRKNILRIGTGKGFRVVNLFTEDHAALTGSREVIITEDLKPEQSYNANVNYVRNFFGDKFFASLDVSGFYTYFSNKIIGDYTVNDQQIIYSNLDGYAVTKGITVNTEFNYLGKLKCNAGITLMDASRFDETTKEWERQVLSERFSGTFSVSYNFQRIGLSVDYTGNIYGPMKLPLLQNDFRAEYSPVMSIQNIQFTKTFNKGWEIYGGVKNLLNHRAAAYSIMRPFDPFDKNADDPATNPFGYTFDASYIYASFQGIRSFFGVRYTFYESKKEK